jgi:hypothetical protein
MISNNVWTRIKRERGWYRYNPSGQYFARVRFRGKLYHRKLETTGPDLVTVLTNGIPSTAKYLVVGETP